MIGRKHAICLLKYSSGSAKVIYISHNLYQPFRATSYHHHHHHRHHHVRLLLFDKTQTMYKIMNRVTNGIRC